MPDVTTSYEMPLNFFTFFAHNWSKKPNIWALMFCVNIGILEHYFFREIEKCVASRINIEYCYKY